MNLSVFVAQVSAVMYLSVGIGMLFDGAYYKKFLDSFYKDVTAMYVGGFIALIIGFAIITFHNEWVKSWEVLVTLLGWIGLLKGILLLAFPSRMLEFSKSIVAGKSVSNLSYIVILLGLVFGYFGFIA